jgi:hypothetical protein
VMMMVMMMMMIIIIIIIIICKPGSIKVVDFPAYNKQQFVHKLWLCKSAQIL